MLAAVDQATDVGDIVSTEGCGLSVRHGDLATFISSVHTLSFKPGDARRDGQASQGSVRARLHDGNVYRIVMSHFESRVAAHV